MSLHKGKLAKGDIMKVKRLSYLPLPLKDQRVYQKLGMNALKHPSSIVKLLCVCVRACVRVCVSNAVCIITLLLQCVLVYGFFIKLDLYLANIYSYAVKENLLTPSRLVYVFVSGRKGRSNDDPCFFGEK